MIAVTDFTGIALVIAALGVAIPSIIAAINATRAHNEVKTLNAKTVGVLAGEQETRRIAHKPLDERTPSDQRHLLDVPPEASIKTVDTKTSDIVQTEA
jgi:hypothetical protein